MVRAEIAWSRCAELTCAEAGDLNFRVNLPRAEVLRTLATSPHAVSDLLPHDELTALKHDDPSFRLRDFREAKIDFEPTYK